MPRLERTKAFKRDYQRVVATPKHRDLENLLSAVLMLLATDMPLPAKYMDHSLRGVWKDFRDCHVKPDLVLIYRKAGNDVLQLVRLGSRLQCKIVSPLPLYSLEFAGSRHSTLVPDSAHIQSRCDVAKPRKFLVTSNSIGDCSNFRRRPAASSRANRTAQGVRPTAASVT